MARVWAGSRVVACGEHACDGPADGRSGSIAAASREPRASLPGPVSPGARRTCSAPDRS